MFVGQLIWLWLIRGEEMFSLRNYLTLALLGVTELVQFHAGKLYSARMSISSLRYDKMEFQRRKLFP